MKLATLAEGGPDGTVVVVDRAGVMAAAAREIAPTLQAALDDWTRCAPQLRALARQLEEGSAPDSFPLAGRRLLAPLPRPLQFLDGSAYPHHMSVIREARGARMPPDFHEKPLMYQGMSAPAMAPTEPIRLAEDEAYGVDFEAEIAVLTDRVRLGTPRADAGRHASLYVLLNDVSLRALVPPELARGFGFLQSKPANAFAPFAVTPDELTLAHPGAAPRGEFVCRVRGDVIGRLDPSVDAVFDYADLIAHAATTRELVAGTVIGAGALANADRARGCGCIAEQRAREQLSDGAARTAYLRFGERVQLEMFGADGRSVFGAIDQVLEKAGAH